jgi:signal transduction histidine kinase/ActR/RegA family two-component response regulator
MPTALPNTSAASAPKPKWYGTLLFRYALPFLGVFAALLMQGALALVLPKGTDFPYAFFYLIAVFVTAWFGGYVPGAIACIATMVGIPLVAIPGFRLATLDLSRLGLLLGVSLLVSAVADAQRRRRQALRKANDELDRRVQSRTLDLVRAVEALESEVAQHEHTEQKLKTQLERLHLLDQITRAIGERQDLRSILQVVIRSLEDSLAIDLGCVCLYDSVAVSLTVTCVGIRSEALAMELAMPEQARIEIDQNGLSRCVAGELVYEPDMSQVMFPFPQRLSRGGLGSMVAAPLLVESKVFGVLVAARRQTEGFSSSDCEFLRQLSEHVALAAHQAQVYEALHQAYNDLRQTQHTVMQQERLRALGQMASGIAHDINNAISPVALYTEMLLEQESNLNERTREYLETTRRSIEDVAHTVARMREFYRQPESQLTLASVDLNLLIQQVVDLTRARWRDIPLQRGIVIELRTELASNPPLIAGIESEIREALTNLIFNAVDAMPEGGTLTLRAKASIRGTNGGRSQHIDLEVADTGLGMDEETRRRCLEPFFTTKGERGTGLGLAMVYGIVQRHGAEIEIESTAGKGTCMRLRFAVSTSGAASSEDQTPQLPTRLRILIVDDDPLLIKSLRDALETDGHAVSAATGGREGIEMFNAEHPKHPFAVVITDLGMPYVDGRKVAGQVKQASPSTPVILLTGWGQRLVAEGDIPPHVDRVLNKPPRLRELRAALSELSAASSLAR